MKSILFADDNKNIREFCRQELEDEGYRILLARDGVEAILLAQKESFDLAILDINMPVVGGFEAARRIKAIAPSVPVMFFTANDEDCVPDHRSELASACVEKTDDLTELKQVVARLLRTREGDERYRSGLPPAKMPIADSRDRTMCDFESNRVGFPFCLRHVVQMISDSFAIGYRPLVHERQI